MPLAFIKCFDFGADSDFAEMNYGFDILEPSSYVFSGPTLRKDVVDRDNTTFRLDLETEQGGAVFKTGFIYNDREVDSLRYNLTEGTVTAPDEVTSDLATSLSGIGIDDFANGLDAPGGFLDDFLIAHFDNTIEAYGAGQFTPVPVDASSWNVQEETMGLYGEVDFETSVFDRPLRVNTGLRIARTFMTSSGATEDPITGEAILLSEDNAYTDVLPSTNIV